MCVTHNNIARGDSLIAFASLTISAKSRKIRLSQPFQIFFCENCAFFLSKWQCQKPYWKESTVLSLEKKLFFWVFFDYFFQFFSIHTLGSRIIFLCSHIFRKRYVFFSKRRLFIFCVFCYVFQRNYYSAFFEI